MENITVISISILLLATILSEIISKYGVKYFEPKKDLVGSYLSSRGLYSGGFYSLVIFSFLSVVSMVFVDNTRTGIPWTPLTLYFVLMNVILMDLKLNKKIKNEIKEKGTESEKGFVKKHSKIYWTYTILLCLVLLTGIGLKLISSLFLIMLLPIVLGSILDKIIKKNYYKEKESLNS